MEYLNKSCFMCGASDCNGIIINGEKICKACEEKIMSSTINELDYDLYKDALKIILFDKHVDVH